MNFEDWRDAAAQKLYENCGRILDKWEEYWARQAWEAADAAVREEMLTQFNRTGVDIDAALHGRVNEKSPIANRLRMIAAAQPRWQPIETAPKKPAKRYLVVIDCGPGTLQSVALAYRLSYSDAWIRDGASQGSLADLGYRVTHYMPLPGAAERYRRERTGGPRCHPMI